MLRLGKHFFFGFPHFFGFEASAESREASAQAGCDSDRHDRVF
jgi:hypothetical protein